MNFEDEIKSLKKDKLQNKCVKKDDERKGRRKKKER